MTSDILKALGKAELRIDARERRIEHLCGELSEAEKWNGLQRCKLEDQKSESLLNKERMEFKIEQQSTKIRKCKEDDE